MGTEAGGVKYHNECFVCVACKTQLAGNSYVKSEEKVYCEPCYRKEKPKAVCAVCCKEIDGNYVTAAGKTYHTPI